MKKSIKRLMDNPVQTRFDVTQRDLYAEIENTPVGQFVKIEYTKIPNRKDQRRVAKLALERINNLAVKDLTSEGFKVLDNTFKSMTGQHKTVFYKRVEDFRDESGYIRFQDEDDNWKKLDVRNIINLTNIDGVKLTRNEQR